MSLMGLYMTSFLSLITSIFFLRLAEFDFCIDVVVCGLLIISLFINRDLSY